MVLVCYNHGNIHQSAVSMFTLDLLYNSTFDSDLRRLQASNFSLFVPSL